MSPTDREDGRTRRARERRNTTHEALLRAARQAFASEGYGKASPEYIAGLAGVSRATFYQHFDTKADAFAAIFDDVLVRLDEAVLGVELRPDDDSPEVQLINNLLRVLEILLERSELTRLLLHEAVGHGDALGGRVEAFFDDVLEMIERSLVVGERAGLVRPLATRLTSMAILGSIKEVLSRRLPPDMGEVDHSERERIAHTLIDFALHGVGAEGVDLS